MYNQSAKEKLKPAFKVALNDDGQVLTISPNEQNFECNTAMEETTAEMNKILTCCHNFLDQKEDTVKQLGEEFEKFNSKFVKLYRTASVNAAKKEMESLIPEVER